MTVFWQHVGRSNSQRDFPLTLGTPSEGLRKFRVVHIETQLDTLDPPEEAEVAKSFSRIANTPFQIWGFPSGSASKLEKLNYGDCIALLDTDAQDGAFRYIGRTLFRIPGKHNRISMALWGDNKFPIIVLIQGHLIHYPWPRFLHDLNYGIGLKPMGRVHTISNDAITSSTFENEDGFYRDIIDQYACRPRDEVK